MNMLIYLQNVLQLVLAPSKGWEDIDRHECDISELTRRCLYPLMAVAALSLFVQLIYNPNPNVPLCVVRAMVIFVSYFVTYHFSLVMFRQFFYHMCRSELPDAHRYTTMVAYSVSLLAIAKTICNVLPVNLGLRYLLPLAVALIMWKSDRYLQVRDDATFAFVCFCVFTTVLPPEVLQALFDFIL